VGVGGSQYDVVVKLSTVGNDQLSGNLKNVQGVAEVMAASLNNADSGTKRLSASFRQTDADGNKFAVTMRDLGAAHGKYVPLVDQLSGALVKVAAAWAALSVVRDVVGDIFSATKAHEDMVTTMAATMTATNSWADSVNIATGQLAKLKETAALVNGTEDQMVGTFTMLKRVFGGTSDEAVTLTQKLALLARQSGASVDELSTRLAAASITGKLQMRGPAGIALTGAGVDPHVLMTMKEAGLAMEYLNATIADNPGLVERLKDGWSYLTAEFKKNKEEALETIGLGLEPLKKALSELNTAISSDESQAGFTKLGANLANLTEQLKGLFSPGSMQENVSWYTGILTGIVAWMSEWIVLMKTVLDTVLNVYVSVWDVITNPMKYLPGRGGITSELKRIVDEQIAILQGAVEKSKKIFATAMGEDSSGDVNSGPTSHTPHETPTKPAPGRGLDLSKIAEENFKAANAVADAWDKAYLETLTGIDKQVAAVDLATQKEIGSFAETGASWNRIVDFMVATTAAGENKKAALIAEAAEKNAKELALNIAWQTGEQEKLADELAGVTLDYYAKEQAAIDKQTAKEKQLIETKLAEHKITQQQYDDDISAMGKVSAARTQLLAQERDSIVGFRRTMEEQAALLVLTTDSVAGGIQAAVKTIAASVKSTTEITRDYVVGAYNALSTGLGTVLLQLETSAGTIKDALKGILNSLLQNFNQMVVEMVKKWLGGVAQMKSGSGGFTDMLGSLFGGQKSSIDAQGNVKFPTGWSSSQVEGGPVQGGPAAKPQTSGQSPYAIGAGIGLGILAGIGAAAPGVTWGNEMAPYLQGAIATISVPIVAAVVLVVGAVITLLTAAADHFKETFYGADMARAVKSGVPSGVAGTALGDSTKFAVDLENSTLSFFAGIFQAADPTFSRNILGTFKQRMIDYLLTIDPSADAGGQTDFTRDVTKIFTDMIPKALMHVYFGQTPNFAEPGGIGGFQKQWGNGTASTVDPSSPLVQFLTGLGFTIDKVNEIAGQIDLKTPEEFKTYFAGIVGVVASAGILGKKLSMSFAETIASLDADAAKNPAGKLASQFAAVSGLIKDVSLYSGDEQIKKGQEAVTAAQQFYDAAKTAMAQLAAMAKQIGQDVTDSTKKVLDALKTPGELAAQSFSDLQHDYDRMRFATNPEDLAKAWAQARIDFEAVAGELVSRIKQIRTVLDDIHTLQAAMLTGPGPNAQTDPNAWLSQNLIAMEKYRVAMLAASPGSPEQIAAATSFAGLIRDRYQMELDLLGRVKSTIEAIDQSIGASLLQLQMQGMGSVVDGKWTPDTHAQGDFMMSQITALQGQLGTAQTPEEVQRIVSQIQTLVGQLGGQQQDPAHFAESLKILQQILIDTQKAADAVLKGMQTGAETDLSKLGTQLQEAETIMQAALTAATTDLDALVWHFKRAGEFAAGQLDLWGTQIADQLNLLGPILAGMVKNFTDVSGALTGTGGTGGGEGKPGFIPRINDATSALGDFSARLRNTSAPGTGDNSKSAPGTNVTLTIKVDVTSGSPEEVATAIGDAVQARVLPILKNSNTELVRALRNNPQVLAR
jgi:flagellar hook-basal body complex protein FliE